ncbi:MAG: hypothetical protein SX243_13915 [Acidobacteriota bacterium]|nr:hypothetical protein [Acidobacteriota bacterium]
MHGFIEGITALFFLLTVAHALWLRRSEGAWLMGSLLVLGAVRENFVILRQVLYGFAPLSLMLGRAPVIAAVIWGYSIYIALIWAEEVGGEKLGERASPRLLTLVGLFMVALVGFYEPFLELIGMARWQEGTRSTAGVPWIALIGYPALACPFLVLWSWVRRRFPHSRSRFLALAIALPLLALMHAEGLQRLKDWLGW